MPKYRVVDIHIRHGVGKEIREYAPGSLIELTEEEAAKLGASVTPVSAKETTKDKPEKT